MAEVRRRRHPRLTEHDKGFYAGVALSVAMLSRQWDRPAIAAEIARELGLTPYRASVLGLTEFDMKPLREIFRERRFRIPDSHAEATRDE